MGTQGRKIQTPPQTPEETGREAAITRIIGSVGCIEEALCQILSAESSKIHSVLTSAPQAMDDVSYDGHSYGWSPCPNLDCALAVNDSVRKMIKSITILEVVLHSKLELFENCICPDDDDDDHHGPRK